MKLLLDQGLPRKTAVLLHDFGFDTLHVGEIGFATAEDREIIRQGWEEDLTRGSLLTVQRDRIRMRRLPLI